MSRATSYDPFATTSSSRSTRTSNNDYGSTSYYNSRYSSGISSRYSSTEQLNSYKPSSSTYRSANSTFTPRNVRAGSVSIGGAGASSASATDSLSRYRPPDTTFSRPISNRYESYSSRTPSSYSSRTSSSSSYSSSTRDYKSMSREKSSDEQEEQEEDVESTFRKLYRKYVTESKETQDEQESLAKQVSRRFESKSEAEESDCSIADDTDILERYQRKGLRRASSASSITPKASVTNTPSITPKTSPLPSRKATIVVADTSRCSSPEDMIPLSRNIEIGATIPSVSESKKTEEETKTVRKIATSIKINGRSVENLQKLEKDPTPETEPVRITIRRDRSKSPNRNVPEESTPKPVDPPLPPPPPPEDRQDREKSTSTESDSSRASRRSRRDPKRTLENLKTSLMKAKEQQQDNVAEKTEPRRIPIPLVLITEPSNPSTPLATTPVATAASICLWNKQSESTSDEDEDEFYDDEEEEEYSSGEWTEGEDDEEYSTDCEFSVSQTFSLQSHLPIFPLANSNSTSSAIVSEFGSGGPADTFLSKEESRGRVDSLFAVPAPTFTCSVSYDGIEEDEDDEFLSDEIHSCDEGDNDEDFQILPIARPGSSGLGAYMSTESVTSDEDYDGRTVGCTLKLVDRAARKDSDESDESVYYEDEEEYWDEEYEYEDEEEEEDEEEDEEYEDEQELEEFYDEEMEEDDDEEYSVRSVEESVESGGSTPKHLGFQQMSLPVLNSLTASQIEEMIEEAVYSELPEDQILAINGTEVEDYTSIKDVNLVPTYVRQMIENVKEEIASRFSDRKPATDFARKAVIQPAKLEKVKVQKVETKIGEIPKEPEEKMEKEKEEAKESLKMDKSAVRKSALNMKDEDAKKKVAADEKAAAEKARKLGTVSALTSRFDETTTSTTKKESPILYRKSSRLQPNVVDKPKRTYEVVKPRINDDFDKQMEEIRKVMKAGATELQTKIKDLSKGILTATEEAKNREMEEKRRVVTEKASGAIEKAAEEKNRWRAARNAEAEREYARIEAEKHLRKKKILIDVKPASDAAEQPKPEPKRTIRRWKPPPPDPNAPVMSFSSGPSSAAPKKGTIEKPTTPTAARRKAVEPPAATPTISSSGTETTAKVPTPPSSTGAAATKIRNNITNTDGGGTTPSSASKRYSARRKTQEIVNESTHQPKAKRRKITARKRKFTRNNDRDIDVMLGFASNVTFEQLENLFDRSAQNRRATTTKFEKIRRIIPTKVFISELTDFDKIYKSSEIRDIIASVNMVN